MIGGMLILSAGLGLLILLGIAGKWRVEQVAPGCYLWRSPEGFVYLVTPSLSLELHDPTRTGRPESPPVVRLRWQDLTSSA